MVRCALQCCPRRFRAHGHWNQLTILYKDRLCWGTQHPQATPAPIRALSGGTSISPTVFSSIFMQATYHGPGQVVLYPVVNVRELGKGVRRFVEGLEDCMISELSRSVVASLHC